MREFFDHRRHQRGSASLPPVLLEVVDLAHEIARRTSGDAGYRVHAPKLRTMAGSARRCCAGSPGPGQSLALCDASLRHIGHELRTRVAMFELRRILRDLDDTIADRLSAAIAGDHVEHAGDLRRRDGIGFDDLDIRLWLE